MARTLKEALNGVNLKNANADSLSAALTTHQASPRTDAQLRAEAERSVGSLYNQKTLAAQQAYDRTALGLRNQLDALSSIYAEQRDNAAANTRQSISQADRRAMSRGMGRSSYTMATLGNMQTEGDKIQNRINTQQTQAASDVQSRLQLSSQQLADVLAGYTVDREMDVLSRVDAQRAKDEAAMRDATQYNNSLIMALADRAQQQQETAFNQGLAQRQFDAGREDAAFAQGMTQKQFEAQLDQAAFDRGITRERLDADLANMLFGQDLENRQFEAGRSDAAFNQGLAREQLNANIANMLFGQDMQTRQFEAGREDAAFSQGMTEKEFNAKLDQVAFDQGISREKLDADLANMLFNQGITQQQFDASRSDAAFQQAIAQKQLDANLSNILFNQEMSQKEFDAKLDQVAFDQGIAREQLDMNIKKMLFDQGMTEKEFAARYGDRPATGSNNNNRTNNNNNGGTDGGKTNELPNAMPISDGLKQSLANLMNASGGKNPWAGDKVTPLAPMGLPAVPINPLSNPIRYTDPYAPGTVPTTLKPFDRIAPPQSTLMDRLNRLA